MTESHVDAAVQARIQAARRRTEDMRRQRAELAAARKAGLARRHARKLAYLTEAEQRQADEPDGQDDDHRASVRTADGSATPTDGVANTTEGAAP